MPERWERELEKLGTLAAPPSARSRFAEGPRGDGMPPAPRRGKRIAAAVVAFAIFGAASTLALDAFSRGGSTVPVVPGPGSLVIVLDGTGNIATAELRFDDRTAEPQVGSHCWEQDNAEACMDTVLSPFAAADFLTVPRGTPVAIQADDELAST